MRDIVTTLLDATGLLLIAAGIAGGLWPFVGPWGLSGGGLAVLGGVWLSNRTDSPGAGP